MKSKIFTNKAFTLIELLVVVLIIGILAAIAVPQYKKAVAKSRATQLITTTKALVEANKAYYLQHGVYSNKLEDLDINFTNETGGVLHLDNGTYCAFQGQGSIFCEMQSPRSSIVQFYSGRTDCYSYATDNYSGDDLCQILTGKTNYYVNCSQTSPCHVYTK